MLSGFRKLKAPCVHQPELILREELGRAWPVRVLTLPSLPQPWLCLSTHHQSTALLTAGITEQEFGSLHQQVAGHNMLDTAKCRCSLSLVGEDIGASGSFLLSHTSSKTREPLTVSTG